MDAHVINNGLRLNSCGNFFKVSLGMILVQILSPILQNAKLQRKREKKRKMYDLLSVCILQSMFIFVFLVSYTFLYFLTWTSTDLSNVM